MGQGQPKGMAPFPVPIQKQLAEARKSLASSGFVFFFKVGFLIAASLLVHHGYNEWPNIYAENLSLQKDAEVTWTTHCNEGKQHSQFVDCNKALEKMRMRVFSKSIEEVVHHLIQDILPFSWLGCTPGSQCSYILWKCADLFFSSAWLVFIAVIAAVCWILYSLMKGPLHEYRQYAQTYKQLTHWMPLDVLGADYDKGIHVDEDTDPSHVPLKVMRKRFGGTSPAPTQCPPRPLPA